METKSEDNMEFDEKDMNQEFDDEDETLNITLDNKTAIYLMRILYYSNKQWSLPSNVKSI